jgi:hypothetical protein
MIADALELIAGHRERIGQLEREQVELSEILAGKLRSLAWFGKDELAEERGQCASESSSSWRRQNGAIEHTDDKLDRDAQRERVSGR